MMCHNREYCFAELKDCCKAPISKLEKELSDQNGKELILIACEKRA